LNISFSWFSGKELVDKQYEEVLDERALFEHHSTEAAALIICLFAA
jgi:hypothetical protein